MNTYVLKNTTTREELRIQAFSWELSKGEKVFFFYCDEEGMIIEKALSVYNWIIWERLPNE